MVKAPPDSSMLIPLKLPPPPPLSSVRHKNLPVVKSQLSVCESVSQSSKILAATLGRRKLEIEAVPISKVFENWLEAAVKRLIAAREAGPLVQSSLTKAPAGKVILKLLASNEIEETLVPSGVPSPISIWVPELPVSSARQENLPLSAFS